MDLFSYIGLLAVLWCTLTLQVINTTRLPGVKVTDVKVISSSEIYVAWQPTYQVKRGKLNYVIRYKPKGSAQLRASTVKTDITLKGLQPETTYIVAIRAVKRRARGDWSKSFKVTTIQKEEINGTPIDANITVDAVGTHTADVYWRLPNQDDILRKYKGFRVVWKNKEEKEEAETIGSNLTLPNLEPETRYSAAVYLLRKTGSKIKLGAVKFQTQAEPITTPRNLRLKSVTDKKFVVKWRHIRQTSDEFTVTSYILNYKKRGVDDQDQCDVITDNSTKTQAIRGVLPDTKYSVRIAGQFDNVTGPFTDWLRVRTLPFNQNTSEVQAYHISPEETLLVWEPFLDGISSKVDLYTDLETLSLSLVKTFYVNDTSRVVLAGLLPDTGYRAVIKQVRQDGCPLYRVAEFHTDSIDCIEESYLESETDFYGDAVDEYHDYDPYLRILPLPIGSHLITWSPVENYGDNKTYIYVLRVLGEPFLYHLSTNVIPSGRSYHVIDDLDVQKTYSISLSVFLTGYEHAVFVSKHLLVLPAKDDGRRHDVKTGTSYDAIWPITSMDIVMEIMNATQLHAVNDREFVSVQQILSTDWYLVSKSYPDEPLDSERDNATDVLMFPEQEAPIIDPIENMSVVEGGTIFVTCMSRGDPYPIMSWKNITANETIRNLGDPESDHRITVDPENYLGYGTYSNGRGFMGTKRFLSIKSVALWQDGLYSCEVENPAGQNAAMFAITVFPKPPEPVQDLVATSVTPFDINVTWRPPAVGGEFITGYHVTLMDEYDVKLRETNITATEMTFTNLDHNTPYKILVSAQHEYAEGDISIAVVKTPRIPRLGPPMDVRVKTHNGTTLQVSWQPPAVVKSNHVRLRTYLFYHRQAGTRKAEEIQLHPNFTDISIIDLEPDENYNVQVVAMSEDGQVSYSDWLNGSTYREAYMDESRPPPPPRNVFLRPDDDNIIVSWLPPFPDENILVRSYIIQVLHNGTKREAMEVDFKESSVIVYEVEMGVFYQISVQAWNKAGRSLERWEEMYIREEYVTQHPVRNFHGVALSSTTLQLLWEAPEAGSFTHFVLSYTLAVAGGENSALPGGGFIPANIRNYIVRSLLPYTRYEFIITPFFKRMKGEGANTTVRTYSDRPENPPENVTLTPVNSTAVLITCSPPAVKKNGPVITYKISFRTKRTWRNDIIVSAEPNEDLLSYVTELLPFTVYEFRVRAMTVNGSGPWSDWHQTRTLAPAPILPKIPTNLKTTATSNSITLSWEPPTQDRYHITGYIVGYGRFIPEVFRYPTTKDIHTYVLNGLDGGSLYIISLRSFNEHGESVAVFELVTTLEEDKDAS